MKQRASDLKEVVRGKTAPSFLEQWDLSYSDASTTDINRVVEKFAGAQEVVEAMNSKVIH